MYWQFYVTHLRLDWNGWLRDISTQDFSNPSFNPGPFNPRLFNQEFFIPGLSNHEFFNSMGLKSSWLKNSWLKSPGLKSSFLKSLWLKGPGLKLGVEKSGVEMFFNQMDDISWCFSMHTAMAACVHYFTDIYLKCTMHADIAFICLLTHLQCALFMWYCKTTNYTKLHKLYHFNGVAAASHPSFPTNTILHRYVQKHSTANIHIADLTRHT